LQKKALAAEASHFSGFEQKKIPGHLDSMAGDFLLNVIAGLPAGGR
jgi:hypothetical protein